MNAYRHVLIAVDFSDSSEAVIERALSVASNATVTLVHVVDYLPTADAVYSPNMPLDLELSERVVDNARSKVAELTKRLGLLEIAGKVEIGSPKVEILRLAEELEVDLIALGSHGKHGWQLLLGSTASAVLHHANCDVLAVRVRTP